MNHKTKIRIVGIDCPTCVYAIERKLKSLGCVRSFKTEISDGIAEIEYDEDICVLRDIYEAIRDAGYDIYKEKIYADLRSFSGEGTHILESKILKKAGVLDVRISQSSGIMTVLYNPLEITRETIARELSMFDLRLIEGTTEETRSFPEKTLLYRRLGSFTLGLLAIILSMYSMFTGNTTLFKEVEKVLPFFALIAIVLNYDIAVRGLKSLARGVPVMDSLIAISSISTLIAGTASITGFLHAYNNLHSSSFFEASAGVMGFVGLGKYLEERLRKRAFKSLEELAESLRGSVRVITDKSVIEKPVSEVEVGEIIEVKAGEIIPVDGVVVEGFGYVDESSFTGEPIPRLKKDKNRDPVLAGSLLQSGYLRVRATRVGSETFIAYVIETVREAESLKPKLARLADKIVGYFTWVVIAIALVTLTYWSLIARNPQLGVMFMAAVLTVACPCALGIATPLVISIAVLKSSRSGALIRAGDVFERILNSDTVVFDKTGTLTIGRPTLIAIHTTSNKNTQEILKTACAVESRSEHPLSRAILEACLKEDTIIPNPSEYMHIPGEGVFGIVNESKVAVGNAELALRLGIQLGEEVEKLIREIGLKGHTPVLVFMNSEVVAVLEVGDKIREEVDEVITKLRKNGYLVGLASGDVETSVKYYKELLGFDFTYWELKPDKKADLIKDLQNRGHKVVFVGDGVNDAPALSTAYVGVAMSSGADISKEAGDVVILNNNLRTLLSLLDFSKLVKRKVLQNIAWAFIYNIALIPIAAGAFYTSLQLFITPEMAATAMILSDISVILNALSILKSRGHI